MSTPNSTLRVTLIMTILKILDALAATSSRLAKDKILKDNASNETLKRTFKLAYDKKILFWTRQIPEVSHWGHVSTSISLASAFDQVEAQLCTRKKTGNEAATFLEHIFRNMAVADAEVLRRVITRDLRVGGTRETANRCWPGLIAKPAFMLCSADYDEDEIGFPAISQTKEDGARCRLEFDGDIATLTSRADNEIEHCGTFNKWAHENLNPGDSLDGELVCFKDGKRLDRKTSNGIVNKAIKGTISPEEAALLTLVAWDLEDTTRPYNERFADVTHFTGKVVAIESRIVNSYAEALAHFKEARRAGLEGTILKKFDGMWEGKRVKFQAKFKAEIEAEFKVVGFDYGKKGTKNEHRVGALKIESECGKVKSDVGIFKDFPDTIRDDLLKEMPKVVTVRYNERITSRGRDTQSLFLPRVISIRWDKSKADTLEDLIKIEAATLED